MTVYKGTPIRLSAEFSAEILQTRWEAQCIQSDEKENPQPRIVYLAKLSRFDEEIKSSTDKQMLKYFSRTSLVSQQ